MLILRFERTDGNGIYRNLGPGYATQRVMNEDRSDHEFDPHPTPQSDPLIDRYPESYEVCGFKDMDQLLEWFPKENWHHIVEFNRKRNDKCSLFEFECPDDFVVVGQKQVIFHKHAVANKRLLCDFLETTELNN